MAPLLSCVRRVGDALDEVFEGEAVQLMNPVAAAHNAFAAAVDDILEV
jgi:hypothetical protein